jgi:hypothetical protein
MKAAPSKLPPPAERDGSLIRQDRPDAPSGVHAWLPLRTYLEGKRTWCQMRAGDPVGEYRIDQKFAAERERGAILARGYPREVVGEPQLLPPNEYYGYKLERIRRTLVALRVPRAPEMLDHAVRQLEPGEASALEEQTGRYTGRLTHVATGIVWYGVEVLEVAPLQQAAVRSLTLTEAVDVVFAEGAPLRQNWDGHSYLVPLPAPSKPRSSGKIGRGTITALAAFIAYNDAHPDANPANGHVLAVQVAAFAAEQGYENADQLDPEGVLGAMMNVVVNTRRSLKLRS